MGKAKLKAWMVAVGAIGVLLIVLTGYRMATHAITVEASLGIGDTAGITGVIMTAFGGLLAGLGSNKTMKRGGLFLVLIGLILLFIGLGGLPIP